MILIIFDQTTNRKNTFQQVTEIKETERELKIYHGNVATSYDKKTITIHSLMLTN